MGHYINPLKTSKEAWLAVHAEPTESPKGHEAAAFSYAEKEGEAIICLVDNGPFTAAAIGHSVDELKAFTPPGDVRPKLWFRAPREKLILMDPSLKFESVQ